MRDDSVLVNSSHQTQRGKSNANLPLSRNNMTITLVSVFAA
jgi:hypothetical protein